jgi:hypothetical protein
MFRSYSTIIRPMYKNLVYEWMDKAFEISESVCYKAGSLVYCNTC